MCSASMRKLGLKWGRQVWTEIFWQECAAAEFQLLDEDNSGEVQVQYNDYPQGVCDPLYQIQDQILYQILNYD